MPFPFISVIFFREEGVIFFPSRAKEAKKQKHKKTAWSQVNHQRDRTGTTWPSFAFTCRLLFTMTTRKSVDSRQFYREELYSAVFICSFLILNISQLPMSIIRDRARKQGLRFTECKSQRQMTMIYYHNKRHGRYAINSLWDYVAIIQ